MKTRKKLFNSLFFVFVACLTISCSKKTDWDMQGLKGRVKHVSTRTFYAEKASDKWVAGSKANHENFDIYYDEEGNYTESVDSYYNSKIAPTKWEGDKVVEEVMYNRNGGVISTIKINYSSNTKLTFEVYNAEGLKENTGETTKNGDNKIISTYSLNNDNKKFTTNYDYNGNGEKIKTTSIAPDYTTTFSYEYIDYDEIGNWTKKLVFEEDRDEPSYIVIQNIEYY